MGHSAFSISTMPSHICNHSDHSGRYAFDEQPGIALWNLNVLAHALSPLLSRNELETLLKKYEPRLLADYSELMRQKLGFSEQNEQDRSLLAELLAMMQLDKSDYTNTWRLLSNIDIQHNRQRFIDHFINRQQADVWLDKYQQRLALEQVPTSVRHELMKAVNPKYILRNHLAQEAIEAAEQGDNSKVETLFQVLKQPYLEQEQFSYLSKPPAADDQGVAISCSS